MKRARAVADLVAVDIGNSKTLVVRIHGHRERRRFRLDHRSLTQARRAAGWRSILRALGPPGTDRTAGLVSSVAPRLTPEFLRVARDVPGRRSPRFRVVGWQDPWPFRIGVHEPEAVGTDRLANVAGLVGLGLTGGVAVDVGTAITLDMLVAGRFVGGVILPGPHLGAQALHEWVEHLPLVDPTGRVPLVGQDTVSAIRAGIGQVTHLGVGALARRFRDRTGARSRIVVTGSGGQALARDLGVAFRADLWLLGLRVLASRV